ncbi:trigger factor [Solirubrobacter pauli]|uniref:Trigger factor n=1 Tax=Solirubrobacter pauli TaxID=166793 RepID=A0A660L4H4_9ACTN|nr:trigger factor [Solirubrobacter pauli]RKQ86450.1 trigger factor [Solirubrobacter pauli]
MANDISTTLTELPESRVRVDAEVGPAEVERRVTQAAKQLARTIRVPGFRAGKAPAPVVIKRIGREAVVDEAVRESLGAWYREAIDDAHVVPVGEPSVDLGELPKEGEPLKFTIEIGVRPKAELGEYKGLEVAKREPGVPDEQVDQELEGLRERAAKLDTVDRQAQRGDFVVMDFAGSVDGVPFPGGEGRDQMIELGSGRLVPGFEDQLEGAVAGEDREVTITFPEDYPAEELAAKEAVFAVTVREVKAKQLPELDDDLAVEAGFDTLDELREDIRSRLSENESQRAEAEFREAALDAAVEAAKVEVPDALIEARAREMWDSMLHSLSHQGINRETYLRLSGVTEEETIEKAKPDADVALRREAVLAAIAEAESLDPTEEEMLEAVAEAGGGERVKPEKLLERLRKNGRLDSLKDDLSQRKAWDIVVESAKPVPATSSDS